ncbi:Conserved hypothetical protein [Prochlorococcus marinus str. MIT 9303]|uniref:Uncharacterized protein n=1 Tax=Prochlorococcus marinus (strain MIT 9303) TaxID=59922 RepID=A2C7Y5_PROM3|nr:Conserved hypothetical protein [Prochlorococcus marinus str. MIT 9303]
MGYPKTLTIPKGSLGASCLELKPLVVVLLLWLASNLPVVGCRSPEWRFILGSHVS